MTFEEFTANLYDRVSNTCLALLLYLKENHNFNMVSLNGVELVKKHNDIAIAAFNAH